MHKCDRFSTIVIKYSIFVLCQDVVCAMLWREAVLLSTLTKKVPAPCNVEITGIHNNNSWEYELRKFYGLHRTAKLM